MPVASIGFDLPFTEAIAAARARGVVLPDVFYGDLANQARTNAFTISQIESLDQIRSVLDSLTDALSRGRTFDDWQRTAQVAELSQARRELVFRNAVQTSYSIGHTVQQREHANTRPFLMWDAINDSRTRPTHAAMDGYIAPIDDPIWRVWCPPAGHNCRCSRISLTEDQARRRGYPMMAPRVDPDPGWGYEKADGQGAALGGLVAKKAAAMPAAVQAVVQQAKPASRAQGVPVSGALTLPRGKGALTQELRATLRVIDDLHGDGALPSIPVGLSRATKKLGVYEYYSMTNKAVDVKVSRNSPHPRITFAHELGHFMDHKGWGAPGFSSAHEAAAEVWRKAITNSPEVIRLKELRTQGSYAELRKYARYATSWHEIWARSYAQWVATRSGDARMIEELTQIKTASASEAYRMSQWGAAEFEPIGKAIDDLFSMLGWRHP